MDNGISIYTVIYLSVIGALAMSTFGAIMLVLVGIPVAAVMLIWRALWRL